MARDEINIADLIDEYGKIVDELAKVQHLIKRQKALDKLIKDKVSEGAEGAKYGVNINTSYAEQLNTELIRAEMSADWVKAHSEEVPRRSIILYRKVAAKRAAKKK